jgi:hypothetical protein
MNTTTGLTIPYGSGELEVSDITKPIWCGPYHSGRLTIYTANLHKLVSEAELELLSMINIVCIFYNENGEDFVMSCHYTSDCAMEDVVADLQTRVILKYQEAKIKQAAAMPSTYVPGPSTLQ